MPDSIPTSAIARPSRALFALALDAQEIDGELAIAMALISSEDEEERRQGEELVTSLLEASADTTEALVTKSDQLLEMAQWMQARAAHLRTSAKQRQEAAAREEEAADALVKRVATVLSFRNPGQTAFALPEHKLASRKVSSVEITDLALVPDRYATLEVKVRVPATGTETNHESLVDSLVQQLADLRILGEVVFDKKPDKRMIAAAIKAQQAVAKGAPEAPAGVPGANLKEGRSWRIA
jgi:hypothetical protein